MFKIKYGIFIFSILLITLLIPVVHVFAYTEVSSDILIDTNWTIENSPYVVNASIMVAKGATLFIDPGVIVKFDNSELDVFGDLVVNGEENNKVYFTSFYDDSVGGDTNEDYFCSEDLDEEGNIIGQSCDSFSSPTDNDWRGIVFSDSHNNYIKNAVFKYTQNFAELFNSYLNIKNVEISDSGSGIFASTSNIDADNFNFINTPGTSLYAIKNSNINWANSLINTVNNDVIYVFDSSNLNLSNFLIKDISGGSAIYVFRDSKVIANNLKIENFFNDFSSAVYVFNNSNFTVDNSIFKNCSGYSCIMIFDQEDYLLKPSSLDIQNSVLDTGSGSGISVSGDSNLSVKIYRTVIKNFTVLGIENYFENIKVDAKNNYWGAETGPYNLSKNPNGLGNGVTDNVEFIPFFPDEEMKELPKVPEQYYAKITNIPNGIAKLYETPNVNATLVKILPNNWIVKVISKVDENKKSIFSDGYYWYKVEDPTDETVHYMFAGIEEDKPVFLPYEVDKQTEYEQKSRDLWSGNTEEKLAGRKQIILDAVEHYYNNTDTEKSLYSSDDHGLKISGLKQNGFPKELILAIIAQEIGGDWGFNNENVSFDYGHGVMQITMDALTHENPSSKNKKFGFQYNKDDPRGIYSEIKLNLCKEINSDQYKKCYKNTNTFNNKTKSYDNYDHNILNPKYKQYANTAQSIYANIKDGIGILRGKNITAVSGSCKSGDYLVEGISFNCSDLKNVKTVWYYNGFSYLETENYMRDVSVQLKRLNSTFEGYNYSDTNNLVKKLELANKYRREIRAHSPIEVRIIDENGNVTGLVNKETVSEIPNTAYDEENERAVILFPDENYTYEVVGDGTGNSYGLDIVDFDGEETERTFNAIDIPIQKGEIHKYTIDWDSLNTSGGVTVNIDKNGDGISEYKIDSGKILNNINEPVPYVVSSGSYVASQVSLLNPVFSLKNETLGLEEENKKIVFPDIVKKFVSDKIKEQEKLATNEVFKSDYLLGSENLVANVISSEGGDSTGSFLKIVLFLMLSALTFYLYRIYFVKK